MSKIFLIVASFFTFQSCSTKINIEGKNSNVFKKGEYLVSPIFVKYKKERTDVVLVLRNESKKESLKIYKSGIKCSKDKVKGESIITFEMGEEEVLPRESAKILIKCITPRYLSKNISIQLSDKINWSYQRI